VLILFALALAGCAGHRLANYDIGLTAGQTEFSGDSDAKRATTVNGRINLHFETK
jgi:hypothetical protein